MSSVTSCEGEPASGASVSKAAVCRRADSQCRATSGQLPLRDHWPEDLHDSLSGLVGPRLVLGPLEFF